MMNGNGHTTSLNKLPIQSLTLPIQASAAAPRDRRQTLQVAEVKPRWIWRVVVWKYNVDAASKWLKRVYFHYVFLNFNRFSYWVFNLLPPNGRDDTGRLCWTEDQGCWDTEWEAEQEAMRYSFGHAVKVPLRASLSGATVHTEQIHPNSPPEVKVMYQRKMASTTIEVSKLDMARLAAKVMSSDRVVENYQTKAL